MKLRRRTSLLLLVFHLLSTMFVEQSMRLILRKVLPTIPRDIESLATNDLQKGYTAMRTNKLQDGERIFQGILHALLVNAVSTASEVEEAKKLITTASEYSIAMSIELERRKLGTDEEVAKSPEKLKRSLELAAYFTIPKLEVPHRQIALTSGMKLAYQNKNFNSALSFANRMLANGGAAKMLDNVSYPPLLYKPFTNNMYRQERSRPNASEIPTTLSKSSLTNSLNSTSVLHHTHPSTLAQHSKSVPLTAANITPSTRGPYVLSAAFAKLERMEVG
jgi:hypothetical protein